MGPSDGGGISCDPLGIVQDRHRFGIEVRLPVILGELRDQRVILRLSTESLSVVDDSVVATVDRGDD